MDADPESIVMSEVAVYPAVTGAAPAGDNRRALPVTAGISVEPSRGTETAC